MTTQFRLYQTVALLVLVGSAAAQLTGQSSLEKLFGRFQSPSTTDSATKELLRLAQSDRAARAYLATRVPAIIQRGPSAREVWANAVLIAGTLKLAEASGALTQWINVDWGNGSISLGQWARLEDEPAAKALAEIGDPALSWILPVLAKGAPPDRAEAVMVLSRIHSSSAREALERDARSERDEAILGQIQQTLRSWGLTPAKRGNGAGKGSMKGDVK